MPLTGATPAAFVETAALLAVMDGDPDRALEILSGFLDGELIRFRDQVQMLDDLCRRDRQRRIGEAVRARAALPEDGTDGRP